MDDFSKRPRLTRTRLFNWASGVFVACFLIVFFVPESVRYGIAVISLVAWLIGFISQSRTGRAYARDSENFRIENVNRNPRVFAEAPPSRLDEIEGGFIDLYDLETGLYIGRGLKRDIQTLYDAFENEPLIFENGPNDIPLTQDFIDQVEQMDDFQLTPHFLELMRNAMGENQFTLLTIRWTSPERPHVE